MKRGQFYIGDKFSEPYGAVIQYRPDLEVPKRRRIFETAFGQDGVTPMDEEAYDTTKLTISLAISSKWGGSISDRRNELVHLFMSDGFIPFRPYFDDTKLYHVMVEESIAARNQYYFEGNMIMGIPLIVQPWKTLYGHPMHVITSGVNLVNPTHNTARPLIKITGSGDVNLMIGGRPYVIKGIVGSIIIDTDLKLIYKEDASGVVSSNESSKVQTRPWPYLNPSGTSNIITWTGSGVTKVEIQERWRLLS